MKEYLEALNKNLIVKALKTLLQLIPIGIITNNIIIAIWGKYDFYWDKKYLLTTQTISAVTIFSVLFLICYFLETSIIPFILSSKTISYKDDNKGLKNGILKSEKILENRYKENPLNKIHDIKMNRYNFISGFTSFPIIIILWLCCINNIWAYCSISIVLIGLFYFSKSLNSIYNHYDNVTQSDNKIT